jgi:Membrane domain of glycerophosphoryl diester phosphodiesterase
VHFIGYIGTLGRKTAVAMRRWILVAAITSDRFASSESLLGGEMADVDLRPMSLGEVLDRTFKLYKNHFWLFAGITALPSGILLVLRIANSAWQTAAMGQTSVPRGNPPVSPGLILTGVAVGAGFLLVYSALLAYAQAATVFAVSDLYLGRTAGIQASYTRVGAKALRVLAIFILLAMVVGVGFLLFIIPGIILGCRAAISVPVSMLEDTNAVRSIERSMQLTKGHAVEIFVILLMVGAMSYVVTLLLQSPFMVLAFLALRSHQTLSFGVMLLMNLSSFLSEVLVGPIGAIALSLMYYNLRVRKEAFDIQHLMATLGTSPTLSSTASGV